MSGLLAPATGQRPHRPLPALYGDLARWALIQADALELLAQMPPASVDAIVTDPPYFLGFKGEQWDGGQRPDGLAFQAFTRAWAEQALRVLRPGGHLACFAASRTQHRAAVGIEDARFEVRDLLLWLSSGVPKSRRMPDGLGSALRPMYEPIVLARKPLDPRVKTIAANVATHGTGALNLDAARIARHASDPGAEGHWPANLALGHAPGCDEPGGRCAADCAVALIDRVTAEQRTPGSPPFSRLCYAAKASRAERETGLDGLPKRSAAIFSGSGGAPRANLHPTVKPIALMRWLTRLVVPPGGVVLDPFAGSGSSGIAALLEGRQFVGLERESDYVQIARARLTHCAAIAAQQALPSKDLRGAAWDAPSSTKGGPQTRRHTP